MEVVSLDTKGLRPSVKSLKKTLLTLYDSRSEYFVVAVHSLCVEYDTNPNVLHLGTERPDTALGGRTPRDTVPCL